MPNIETKKHEPIVYRIHDLICDHQGKYFTVRWLCHHYWGKYTKSLDTLMRTLVETGVNDRMMQGTIISTRKGYLHPFKEQQELIDKAVAELDKAARSLFYRKGSILYRAQHDGFYKLNTGGSDSPTYEAFNRENDEIIEAQMQEEISKAKKHVVRKGPNLLDADPDAFVQLPEIGQQAAWRL